MIVAATSVQRALRPSNSKIFNGRCKILRIIFLLVGCSIAWLLKWTPYVMQTTVCQMNVSLACRLEKERV